MQLPWSRRFFGHKDRTNWPMPYIDVIFITWCHMRIWHQPIWPKEVSKQPQSHTMFLFRLKNSFKMQKLINVFEMFHSSDSFVFFANFFLVFSHSMVSKLSHKYVAGASGIGPSGAVQTVSDSRRPLFCIFFFSCYFLLKGHFGRTKGPKAHFEGRRPVLKATLQTRVPETFS